MVRRGQTSSGSLFFRDARNQRLSSGDAQSSGPPCGRKRMSTASGHNKRLKA